MKLPRTLLATGCLFLIFTSVKRCQAQVNDDEANSMALSASGPLALIETGRAAFSRQDFATAEAAFEQFIKDYGEAEEVAEAVRLHQPLLAISKVGLHKHEEALHWIQLSLEDAALPFALSDELSFWRGLCLVATGKWVDAQHALGAYWAEERHSQGRRYEALLLFGNAYIQQGYVEYAADFFASQLPRLWQEVPEVAGRAVVMELYCRLQAGQQAEASRLVESAFPQIATMTQAVSFQLMALQLSHDLLEAGEWHDAIRCLQRLLPAARLETMQSEKIAWLEQRIADSQGQPESASLVNHWQATLTRVTRELDHFRSLESFDAAVRLRIANAFRELERYREAALILDDMWTSMEDHALLEDATLTQIHCWMEIRHWKRAVIAAERYEEAFGGESQHLPTVMILKAEALREDGAYGQAQLTYGEVVERFPQDPMAPRAMFLQGFLYLQQDDVDGALFQFDQVLRRYPESELQDDATYWTGMSLSLSSRYEEARQHLRTYLETFPAGKYVREAEYRIAFATFSLAEYANAVDALSQFIEHYSEDPLSNEALLLLGDALLGEGRIEEGFLAYARIEEQATRLFEEAWFKKGHAYQLLEAHADMQQHYETFMERFPESPRFPEAVYWLGWTWQQLDQPDSAREVYWEVVELHGNDPEKPGLVEVLAALPGLYRTDEKPLLDRLSSLKEQAIALGQLTLATRLAWTESHVLKQHHPELAKARLLEAAKWVDPQYQSPPVSVAVAEALLADNHLLTAKQLFTDIRKWHPRALERDRIYLSLAQIAHSEGDRERALLFYDRFEREMTHSPLLGDVLWQRAEIQMAHGELDTGRATLERLLEHASVSAERKATALLRLGEALAESGVHEKAVVCFERVYVAYGKFSALNARAYAARAASLDTLGQHEAAKETRQELTNRPELADFEETRLATQWLAAAEEPSGSNAASVIPETKEDF